MLCCASRPWRRPPSPWADRQTDTQTDRWPLWPSHGGAVHNVEAQQAGEGDSRGREAGGVQEAVPDWLPKARAVRRPEEGGSEGRRGLS